MQQHIDAIKAIIEAMPLSEKVDALNKVREELHSISPFKNHPTDYTRWVKSERVQANDYNPNKVAKPEMKLLSDSIKMSGITMNVVAVHDADSDVDIVVDGFHRKSIIGSDDSISHGYIPLSTVGHGMAQRRAATIAHNRARGKHEVELMVAMLEGALNDGEEEVKIAKHWGMEAEELIRLKRESGIGSHYANQPHSKAWVRDTDDVVLADG